MTPPRASADAAGTRDYTIRLQARHVVVCETEVIPQDRIPCAPQTRRPATRTRAGRGHAPGRPNVQRAPISGAAAGGGAGSKKPRWRSCASKNRSRAVATTAASTYGLQIPLQFGRTLTAWQQRSRRRARRDAAPPGHRRKPPIMVEVKNAASAANCWSVATEMAIQPNPRPPSLAGRENPGNRGWACSPFPAREGGRGLGLHGYTPCGARIESRLPTRP